MILISYHVIWKMPTLMPNAKRRFGLKVGLECGKDKGKVLIVVRALYGLKSAGASWRAALAKVLAGLGFESTTADPMS
jgi:hypothetical protein